MASTGLNLASVSGVSAKARNVCPAKAVPVMAAAPQALSGKRASSFAGRSIVESVRQSVLTKGRASQLLVSAIKDGAVLDRPLRVAVIGGGPSGACAAETLAQGGVETYLIERKMDNCKVFVVFRPFAVFGWYLLVSTIYRLQQCSCTLVVCLSQFHVLVLRAICLEDNRGPRSGRPVLHVAHLGLTLICLWVAALRRSHPSLHGRRVRHSPRDH